MEGQCVKKCQLLEAIGAKRFHAQLIKSSQIIKYSWRRSSNRLYLDYGKVLWLHIYAVLFVVGDIIDRQQWDKIADVIEDSTNHICFGRGFEKS